MAAHTRPVVLCGPSGVGKSTLLTRLMKQFEGCFAFTISHTTRKQRPGEEHGKNYFFVSEEEMKRDIEEDKFVEHVSNYGNYYGTSIQAIKSVMDSGRICLLDIDTNGVLSIKKTSLQARCVFVMPPSFQNLKERLVGRGTESDESLQKRLDLAEKEIKFGQQPGMFDLVIMNDDLDRAYQQILDFLKEDIEAIKKQKS